MQCSNPFGFRPGPVSFWTTIIYLAVAVPLIYVHETVPPAPSDHSLYRGLNLSEAWLDLETISNSYHPYNSHVNDEVRAYLLGRSKEILSRNDVDYSIEVLGPEAEDTEASLERNWYPSAGSPADVTIFDDQISNVTWTYPGTTLSANINPDQWSGQYFEGNNLFIYIRGKEDPEGAWWESDSEYKKTHRKGGVLVNCHFDSVATGYGATDDGMACVSMLQMLSYFTSSGRQPTYGIILLFNNAEEPGLLGARAFGNSPVLSFCHTFVNLEGAGAGGRAILLRTTDLQMAEAYSGSPHPFGSIINDDAFKAGLVKSGTDYQIFSQHYGQRGMDIAFYEPRARYHTEEDDARHTSVNSIWHMLSAAIASTEKLSKTTGTIFNGARPDAKRELPQNGKPTRGVWFDLFGSAWAAFALRGLFAWSLTLLVATPLALLLVTYVLVRQDKYYFFTRDIKIHSELDDDPVLLGGWKGFFRFPVAFIFAAGVTIASAFLLAEFNPFIIYSSEYAVWAMSLSLFYFAFWFVMRGASVVRPSALHRGFSLIWLFVLGWAFQVLAAVMEDRLMFGSLYFAAFLQSAVFAALFISIAEQFALPAKQEFAMQLHDAHQARDIASSAHLAASGDAYEDEPDEAEAADASDDDGPEATETTPLRAGEQDYGSNEQTTFASTYRHSVAPDADEAPKLRRYAPYQHEQSWSGHLPTWTWIIQFLLLAPVPVILIGGVGLASVTGLKMTGTDGGAFLPPFMVITILSIFLLAPLTPFLHRVTHHVPVFLLFIFLGTFIYNLAAFPFSVNNRFKFYFQQVVDLDEGTNTVALSGVEDYLRTIIASLPFAAGQEISCSDTVGRALVDCRYDASTLPPNPVDGKNVSELMNVTVSRSGDNANLLIDALETRTCYIDTSDPIFNFEVDGGNARDTRFGPFPPKGLSHLQVWRRDWQKPWNITLQLVDDGKSADDSLAIGAGDARQYEEIKGPVATEVTVRCAYSDANKPSTIPAFHELRKYMPTWAVATKKNVGLVEVKRTFKIPAR